MLLPVLLLLVATPGAGQTVTRRVENRDTSYRPYHLVLPYAFYSESFSFALGVGAAGSGLLGQEQFSGFVAGSAGTNGSWSVIAGGWGLRLGHRLFLDPRLMAGSWVEPRLYVDGNPDFPHERAGSNDSSEDNFVDGAQDMGWATADLRYILPLGHGRDPVVTTYWLEEGLLAADAIPPLLMSHDFHRAARSTIPGGVVPPRNEPSRTVRAIGFRAPSPFPASGARSSPSCRGGARCG